MNALKKSHLIGRMGKLRRYNGGVAPIVMPLVDVEEYFDGSEGGAQLLRNSLVNLDDQFIQEAFDKIRARAEVLDVKIALVSCDDGEWPFSDKVVVVTRATCDEVASWLPNGLEADEIWEGSTDHLEAEEVKIPIGYRAVWLWYD